MGAAFLDPSTESVRNLREHLRRSRCRCRTERENEIGRSPEDHVEERAPESQSVVSLECWGSLVLKEGTETDCVSAESVDDGPLGVI
jgi:hypothetical protein